MPKVKLPPPPMGELTDEIHIDTSLIPSYVAERLAAATLDFMIGIYNDPVAYQRLKERRAARLARSEEQTRA